MNKIEVDGVSINIDEYREIFKFVRQYASMEKESINYEDFSKKICEIFSKEIPREKNKEGSVILSPSFDVTKISLEKKYKVLFLIFATIGIRHKRTLPDGKRKESLPLFFLICQGFTTLFIRILTTDRDFIKACIPNSEFKEKIVTALIEKFKKEK